MDLDRILVKEVLNEKVKIFTIKPENRKVVIRDHKPRLDAIQIRVGNHISLIWDLKENEEVTYLMGWKHLIHPACIIRSGHQLATKEGT